MFIRFFGKVKLACNDFNQSENIRFIFKFVNLPKEGKSKLLYCMFTFSENSTADLTLFYI